MHPLIAKTLDIARAEVGVHEVGTSNTGVRVNEYLRSCGLGPGYPWCAAFVAWSIEDASDQLNTPSHWLASASCDTLQTWAREHDLLETTPQAGDVFLLRTASGYAHHTGFVSGVEGERFLTVEGNTSITGSRDGTGVFPRSRPISDTYRYIRWARLLPGETPDSYAVSFAGAAGKHMTAPVIGGSAYVPVRAWGEIFTFAVGWDQDAQAVTFNGHAVPVTVALREGTAYAPLRKLAEFSGLSLSVDGARRQIVVGRQGR